VAIGYGICEDVAGRSGVAASLKEAMMRDVGCVECRLVWGITDIGERTFTLWGTTTDDQLFWIADFHQGPFDTSLEVAQWAWRNIARLVPPSTC